MERQKSMMVENEDIIQEEVQPQTETRTHGALYDYAPCQANDSTYTLNATTTSTITISCPGEWYQPSKSALQFNLGIAFTGAPTSAGIYQILTWAHCGIFDQIIVKHKGKQLANLQYHDFYQYMLQEIKNEGKEFTANKYFDQRRKPQRLFYNLPAGVGNLDVYPDGFNQGHNQTKDGISVSNLLLPSNTLTQFNMFPDNSFIQFSTMNQPFYAQNALPTYNIPFVIPLKHLLKYTFAEIDDFPMYFKQSLEFIFVINPYNKWLFFGQINDLQPGDYNESLFQYKIQSLQPTGVTNVAVTLNNMTIQMAVPRQLEQRVLKDFTYNFAYVDTQSSNNNTFISAQFSADPFALGLKHIIDYIAVFNQGYATFAINPVSTQITAPSPLQYNCSFLETQFLPTGIAAGNFTEAITSIKIQCNNQVLLQQTSPTDFQLSAFIQSQLPLNRLRQDFSMDALMYQNSIIPIKYYEDDDEDESLECDTQQALKISVQLQTKYPYQTLYCIRVFQKLATYTEDGDLLIEI